VTVLTPELADVEIRSSGEVDATTVNFPKRLITVVAVPYEQPAEIFYRGRRVTEVVSRNAFGAVEVRNGKVKVNHEHNLSQIVGKVTAMHSREDGLITELRVARTQLGDEMLELCDMGVLGASVGFALLRSNNGTGPVYPDAEEWDATRTRRRLKRLRLDHIALTGDPAYDTRVLDVRSRNTQTVELAATPNLDTLLVAGQRAALDTINEKYRQ
jgi:phage head maturation protease